VNNTTNPDLPGTMVFFSERKSDIVLYRGYIIEPDNYIKTAHCSWRIMIMIEAIHCGTTWAIREKPRNRANDNIYPIYVQRIHHLCGNC